MKRKQALEKACFLLREQAKEESLARFLLMYLLDEDVRKFNNNINLELEKKLEEKYFNLINEHILTDKPLSHLVGFDYFFDRKFIVNKFVLSPRMETEELVYTVINYIRKNENNNIKILDLCTGSGIIGISLAKEIPSLLVTASDISCDALSVAKENAKNLKAHIDFIQSDIFENIEDKFDIIVSNPPYISYSEKDSIENNVINYDPHIALFADEDGLYFYRKILEQAENYLTKEGLIFFEIGFNQKNKIIDLAKKNNFDAEILKDLNGRARIAIVIRIKK
ncbi:peptide chain release factor N(5)-glutamine methyltransferase [Gemella sp. zg-1178]|uniref:peptide chain release factor N(5)-glutamine methyltransferase n=1 Tax=Gemella sp. zg-1178 TaxID=2840372 RepID=UPI001C0451F6|nr:peptide chain release factor N(5)-glutamine methyltransferase [Gemella sp. zg-1178]MBU0278294.1 peptide chain release factor N(5)-glutamine methyltransferase [Gemella sp. zg-1178]